MSAPRHDMDARIAQRHVVSTDDLATEIEKHERRLNDEYTVVNTREVRVDQPNFNDNGGREEWKKLIALRMELYQPDTDPKSFARRIWSVLHREYPTTQATIGEAMVMSCGVGSLRDVDIPTLPWSLKAADESIECWTEDEDWTPKELRRLKKSLMNFSKGYVIGEGLVAAEIVAGFLIAHAPVEEAQEAIAA